MQTYGLYYKCVTVVIYDRNDSNDSLAIALARLVNYDRKVCCKLYHYFTIVNYNL